MPEPETPRRPRLGRSGRLVGAARRRQARRPSGVEDEQALDSTTNEAPAAAVVSSDEHALLTDEVSSAPSRDVRQAQHRPLPTWRRMLRDLVRPSRAQAVMALILCLCAMATVWQVRARASDQAYSQMRRPELVAMLEQLNTNSGQLRDEIRRLETTKRELQTGANTTRVAQEQARKRVQELQILAGTAPAQGPGVTITIADPQGKVSPELLLDAIEEMRDAGAEAIDLNGVRVVASSWLGRGTDGIVVDGVPIEAPYVLVVIGDPQTLEEGARFRGGLVSQAQAPQVGAQVTIRQSDELTITSLHTPKAPQFARPA
ncbi:DUF881 domain-containing protein [Aestuariimicrobium ganziense]|uniref:DUF881 domain-containing protein n=1 Tax=Aestuariimicrobium ganziense TaxID=2773677 RepID=UPI002E2C0A7F|nr:DUF881 domain-containing protein [Aestuariimicrobium ganziense]